MTSLIRLAPFERRVLRHILRYPARSIDVHTIASSHHLSHEKVKNALLRLCDVKVLAPLKRQDDCQRYSLLPDFEKRVEIPHYILHPKVATDMFYELGALSKTCVKALEAGATTVESVAKLTHLPKTSVTVLVKWLVREGYLTQRNQTLGRTYKPLPINPERIRHRELLCALASKRSPKLVPGQSLKQENV